jgi:hypothetical protein
MAFYYVLIDNNIFLDFLMGPTRNYDISFIAPRPFFSLEGLWPTIFSSRTSFANVPKKIRKLTPTISLSTYSQSAMEAHRYSYHKSRTCTLPAS